jgi:hypothetical protein
MLNSQNCPTGCEAHLILLEFTNHPVCPKERDLFINGAATPLKELRR